MRYILIFEYMVKELKKIITEKVEVTLLEDGVVENHIKAGATIDAEDIIELKKLSSELVDNKPYVILITSGEMALITKEARELSASKALIENAMAKAMVISSVAQKIIGNFYLQVNKPYLPTKLFSDRQKALDWLRSFKK